MTYSELVGYNGELNTWSALNPNDGTEEVFNSELGAQKALYGWAGNEGEYYSRNFYGSAERSTHYGAFFAYV